MSAFFLSINRDRSEFDGTVAADMMAAIDHFGHDDKHLVVQKNFALGYQSLWTVPEEVGERQPLYDKTSNSWLVFHGRIDNRDHLIDKVAVQVGSNISDAALLHRYFLQYGEAGLGEVIGPFALVIYYPEIDKIVAARDSMGGRNLVYRVTDQHIHISTYELALVAHPDVAYRFNHARIGRMLGRLMEDQLSSTIRGVAVLKPGEMISLHGDSLEVQPKIFYRHDASKRIKLSSDQAYADEFKRLLGQAVQRRTRSIGPTASMMSGGFDSVPMSILLAQELGKMNQRLTALSWTFDRHPDADEREYSSEICAMHGIEQVCINCDDVWPALDQDTHVDPVMPIGIPYSEYQQVTLKEAQRRGIRTVMSGIHGDLLYGYTDTLLVELLGAGRLAEFSREFQQLWRDSTNRWQLIKTLFLAKLPGMRNLIERRRLRKKLACEWLQDDINELLSNQSHDLWHASARAIRPMAYRVVLGGFAGEDVAFGRHMEAKFAVERRYPFRDRELCEFMLSIPSDQLYFNSTARPIVRRAFENEFSAKLMARRDKTVFTSMVSAGIVRDDNCKKWFNAEPQHWQYYVKDCYFKPSEQDKPAQDLVQWQCGYYNYWKSQCYNFNAQTFDIKQNDHDK